VGARGQRTHQRILDAALRVFGDEGYHRGSVDRIAKLGGCSRVSFYQYFASKEDVFRHLAAQVARQLRASTDALDPLTPDLDGWHAMRAWVERYAETYERYEPVFNTYQLAVESDEVLATAARRTTEATVARIHARLAAPALSPRQLDPVIRLLLECVSHTFDVTGILRAATPGAYARDEIEVVVTDVVHRTLFGRQDGVNVHAPPGPPPPRLEFGAAMRATLEDEDAFANPTLATLLDAGRDVLITRGFHNARVDDVVAAAGMSHGAFYRYFRNKAELARVLTARAMRTVGASLAELPALDTSDRSRALRRWLRRFNGMQVEDAALMRAWVDGALQDPALRADSAPPLDWGRRRLANYLRPRAFGDVDADAVFLVGLLGVFGARRRPPAEIEAAAHIVERGLLGQ